MNQLLVMKVQENHMESGKSLGNARFHKDNCTWLQYCVALSWLDLHLCRWKCLHLAQNRQ